MAIKFPLSPRTILLCDYGKSGFVQPEMIKLRPAIIVSPRLPYRDRLCAVVPLSGTAPGHAVDYVVRIELDQPLPEPFPEPVWWAKCDMIATVSFDRLDMFRTDRDQEGKRQYLQPKLDEEQFAAVKNGVLAGLGLST